MEEMNLDLQLWVEFVIYARACVSACVTYSIPAGDQASRPLAGGEGGGFPVPPRAAMVSPRV